MVLEKLNFLTEPLKQVDGTKVIELSGPMKNKNLFPNKNKKKYVAFN